MIVVNEKKAISRRIAKGYNRQESIEQLQEIIETSPNNSILIATLVYWDFITVREAEKMEAK